MSVVRKTVPLRHHGVEVGEAVIECDENGVRVLSTNITDPEVKRLFEEDILRLTVGAPKQARRRNGGPPH